MSIMGECVCGLVVGIHQGLLEGGGWGVSGGGGQRSASSQTDDPADRLTFCGGFNSWGGGGSAAEQPGESRDDGEG